VLFLSPECNQSSATNFHIEFTIFYDNSNIYAAADIRIYTL